MYSFLEPSSAVTVNIIVLSPTFKDLFPVPDKVAFESLMSLVYPDATEMEDKLGIYTFIKDEDGLYYLIDDEVKYEATTYGLTLPENFNKNLFSIKVGIEYFGFS